MPSRRAAIYARHSHYLQETSSEDQISRCQKLCAARGYEVVRVFKDESISGDLMINRPEVLSLLENCRHGRFDYLICEDLCRLSRDLSEISQIHKMLSFNGVKIETATDGEISKVHIGMKGFVNDIFLDGLRDKTKRGKRASAEKGVMQMSRVYGYRRRKALDKNGKVVKGQFEVDEAESEVVQQIFEMFVEEDLPTYEIARRLNKRGLTSPRESRSGWGGITVRGSFPRQLGVLRQTLYIGKFIYNRTERQKNPETGRIHYKIRPKSEWMTINVPDLSFIETSVFDKAQIKIDEEDRRREEHKQYIDKLDPKAAKKRQAERHAQRQSKAKKLRQRKNRLYVFSLKAHCSIHRARFKAVTAGFYV